MNSKGFITTALLVAGFTVGTALLVYGLTRPSNTTNTTINSVQVAPAALNVIMSAPGSKDIERVDLTGEKEKRVVRLYGEVAGNSDGIAKQITHLGQTGKDPIYLLIDSPGGSVLDGALVVSAIEASKVPVYTVCERLCASMAFIIHQYGTKRLMVDRAILMAHPASGGVQGTLEQMNSQLGTIMKYVYKFDAYIANRAGLTLEQFLPMQVSEMWIDAEDATAKKFNDGIVNLDVNPTLNIMDLFKERQNRGVKERFNIRW